MTRVSQLQGPLTFTFTVPAGAATDDTTWSLGVLPYNATVTSVEYVPDAAITAHATNNFVLDLKVGSTVVATRSYAATNSVANTKESMTLSATTANRNVSSGDVLNLVRTHGASGLASPRLTVVVTVQIR